MELTWVRCQCIPAPYAPSLDDEFVGTFHHAGANRPALVSKGGIAYQGLSLAEARPDAPGHPSLSQIAPQPTSQMQERMGTSMSEDMQAAVEHLVRNRQAGFHQGFEQLADVFCRMGKIQDAQRVGPMPRGFWPDTSRPRP